MADDLRLEDCVNTHCPWSGDPVTADSLTRYKGKVVAYVDGRRFRGDPQAIVLRRHAQIQLELGQPLRAPVSITFPSGL